MNRTVFASVFCYALAKFAGSDWKRVIEEELRQPLDSEWPGIRTLGRLRDKRIADKVIDLANGATLIAKARSKAAGAFLSSDADVWVTVDDDVETGQRELAMLVDACRTTRGVVSAPCLLRGYEEAIGNYAFDLSIVSEPTMGDGWTLLRIVKTGFGLCALHRDAVQAMARAAPMVTRGPTVPHVPYPALFLEHVDDGEWVSDDCGFSVRAQRAETPLFALCNIEVLHAGRTCRLLPSGELQEKKTSAYDEQGSIGCAECGEPVCCACETGDP